MPEPESAVTELSEFRERRHDVAGLPPMMPGETAVPLPLGTVTFLLTDIEGSTRAWESHGSGMTAAVTRHYEILDAAVAGHDGVRPIEQGEGDSVVAAFASASDAVAAALEAQQGLANEAWPGGVAIGVRMALHTGETQVREGRYYSGPTIIRCARLRALAHGGQVLISGTTADLLADGLPSGASLLPLGVHRLRDLRHPERVFQLAHPQLAAAFPALRSLDALPNNLPVQLTSFIGREAELAQLGALAAEHRLVTLVGAGGCGKTRLAAQLAADVADVYPDGVWWAELAAVTDPDLVPWAVMNALGLGDDRGLAPVERMTAYLGDQRVLVLLDNCEHVLASAAGVVDGLLRCCPQVAAVATSREPLGIAGEVVWRVPPLSVPGESTGASTDAILDAEGVRLFVERAVDARPSFRLDEGNAPTVAAICTRLDGLPLAIELAAARVRSLTPERILAGLADRFRLLTGGTRTAMARQQTLQASVEWSHHLLSDEERVLFRRLATFSGGFSLEAAEAIGAGGSLESWEVLGVLSGLVDKSLVAFDGERYRLLQTIRDFANTVLLASGEANAVRDRHAAWFLEAAEAASLQLEREVRSDLVVALEADHDNLRAALEWSVVKEDDDLTLRLVVALAFFWLVHGHFSEGLSWHRRILARSAPEASSLRCKAFWGLGHLSLTCVELSRGLGLPELEEAMKLARELGDPALLARPLADQGVFQLYLVPDAAPATMEEAIAAARRSGDEWAVSLVLWWQAFYWVLVRNRLDLAEPILRELDAIGRRAANMNCLHWNDIIIGMAAWHEGRLADARVAMERARAGADDCDDPLLEMHAVEWQTGVRIAQGDYDGARALAHQTALRLTRSLDGCRQGFIEFGLAEIALARGELAEATLQAERTAPVIREIALPFKLEKLEALCGRVALARGDLPVAGAAFHAASDLAEQAGIPWMLVDAHHCRGLLARAEENLPEAEDWHHRALALEVEYGFRGVAAGTLEALASLAAAGGNHAEAARLFGAAGALRQETGQARWPLDQPIHDADLSVLREALGEQTLAQLWKEGTSLSLGDAAAYASRARGERKRPRSGWAALTPTELEVVALAAQGLTNAQIGQQLFISAGTARTHLSHIYAKLGVANRAQLAAEATARGATGVA